MCVCACVCMCVCVDVTRRKVAEHHREADLGKEERVGTNTELMSSPFPPSEICFGVYDGMRRKKDARKRALR